MELSLEGILETLLVGAIASLLLLTMFFLLFGHLFRIIPLKELFNFVFYEDQYIKKSDNDKLVSETYQIFLSLLLVAVLFGLGILSQSLSDVMTSKLDTRAGILGFKNDPEMKIASFNNIGNGLVKAKSVDDEFAQFYTDYLSCRGVNISILEKGNSPCHEIYSKVFQLYYSAKSKTFSDPQYYQELMKIEGLINFTRATSQQLSVLFVVLLTAALYAGYMEWRYDKFTEEEIRQFSEVRREWRKHWRNMSALRLLNMSVACLIFSYLVLWSWQDAETNFDNRIFGYYLSPTTSQKGDKPWIPASNYRLLAMPSDLKNAPFEASAVELLGESRTVIVANDKDGQNPFWAFTVAPNLDLTLPKPLCEQSAACRKVLESGLKFESIDVADMDLDENAGRYHVFAATSFSTGRKNGLYYLDIVEQEKSPGTFQISDVRTVRLPQSPCLFVDPEGGDCVVEGMTTVRRRNQGNDLLLGVRFVKGAPVMMIVHFHIVKRDGELELIPDQANPVYTIHLDKKYSAHGISGLKSLKDGRLLMLTSVERVAQKGVPPLNQVEGSLWLIPDLRSSPAKDIDLTSGVSLVAKYSHKPEGITLLDDNEALIVFDDDNSRKNVNLAPSTFFLHANESVYAIQPIQ